MGPIVVALIVVPTISIILAYWIINRADFNKLRDLAGWLFISSVVGFFVLFAVMEDIIGGLQFINVARAFFVLSYFFIVSFGDLIKLGHLKLNMHKALATLIMAIVFYIILTTILPAEIVITDNLVIGTQSLFLKI